MKRHIALVLVLMLVLSLYACGEKQQGTSKVGEAFAQMGNPVTEVAGTEQMQTILYFWIDAPERAENVRYSVISGQIGQVQYTLDQVEYCYRASAGQEDISGVYGPFEEITTNLLVDHSAGSCEIKIQFTVDGGAVANWKIDNLQYSLSADTITDADAFGAAARERVLFTLDSL